MHKTDFLRFKKCARSAHYGWREYASNKDEDAFLQFLADEGRAVEKAARRLFANPIVVSEMVPMIAHRHTHHYLSSGEVTLFEPCLIFGNFIVRPDVLVKRDRIIYLIEVKSKLGDQAAHRAGRMLFNCYGDVRAAWRDFVYDLTFQTEVISRAFPDAEIVPYLLLPEGKKQAHREEIEAAMEYNNSCPTRADDKMVKDRRAKSVLRFFCAKDAVRAAREAVSSGMDEMERVWVSGATPTPRLKYQCKNCEFRVGRIGDGWHKCWGDLAEPQPHLFDLFQLYSLRTHGNGLLANQKIENRKTGLNDIAARELHGRHATRQRIQLTHQRDGKEWIDPQLRAGIIGLDWPVIFLDFETSMGAIPWYSGVRPYELMPFQFSAHILRRNGKVDHREWLNLEDQPPMLAFIRELSKAIGETGSVLVYTDYENRVLTEARDYLTRAVPGSESERAWITDLLDSNRIVDQHDWVLKWYFHPAMSGRTSIKKVLPAVWHESLRLRHSKHFEKYFALNETGTVIDPYGTLPRAEIAGVGHEVREGCAAMTVYREMIRGIGATDSCAKAKLASLLREYVTLDTASQWMIFEHWRHYFRISSEQKNEQV